ncbi:ABC-F family ATP-binding cassette domain-containing protein [Pedobacter sp. AW31-3R]|uniref:ABC-F family ATP-binding cassette domain-containing protein n=1 Tax=Pedobacter sp. AW31-3R TaxID=3445781 RepID=UPI003F9EC096
MLNIQHLSYIHPNKELLFGDIHMNVNQQEKIALIGNNGCGKSTLLKIIAGELPAACGKITAKVSPYYVPQLLGQINQLSIAEALRVEGKINALKEILHGKVTEENYLLLNDDWTIEERCREALEYWQLPDLDLNATMGMLSGGQKTKVFLAGISIHQAELILLDEPSNQLDLPGRELLYRFIQSTSSTLVVVSHDRKLLNLMDTTCELNQQGISVYGGNYDFYDTQKQIENQTLKESIQNREKALRKAKEKERETAERQQKLDARGKKKQEKSGVSRIMMNTLRNSAENSSSKIREVHEEKIGGIAKELSELRSAQPGLDKMKFGFDRSSLHKGKILFTASGMNYGYRQERLWPEDLSFHIRSAERIALKGKNGSGKTTLIKIILGNLEPHTGSVYRSDNLSVYIDQEYSLINDQLSVYGQAQIYNTGDLQEHEIKIRLNRFLFSKEEWNKPCSILSGGERMRLCLACLTICKQAPDIIILDEPTNNLDMQNIDILAAAVMEYQGTLIVVSHDVYFLNHIGIEKTLQL